MEVLPRPPNLVAPGVVSPELAALIMKLLAKHPERRPRDAAEFCDALEALAKADKLGARATPAPENQAAAHTLDLVRALSTTPVSSELVALDGAPAVPLASGSAPARPEQGPSVPAPPLAPRAQVPPSPGHAPQTPAALAELASTLREIPVIEPSDERRRPAEQSQEVEGLRVALGLRIEEPAFEVDDPCQVSALVVNLERGQVDAETLDSTTGSKAGPSGGTSQTGAPRVRRLARPVEERQYVPRLSAPARRPSKASSETPNLARPPSRFARVARGVVAALLLLGAAAAAYLILH